MKITTIRRTRALATLWATARHVARLGSAASRKRTGLSGQQARRLLGLRGRLAESGAEIAELRLDEGLVWATVRGLIDRDVRLAVTREGSVIRSSNEAPRGRLLAWRAVERALNPLAGGLR